MLPRWRGQLETTGVALVVEGGARLTLARGTAPRLRLALAGGSADETPALHGRAALGALALAVHCQHEVGPAGRIATHVDARAVAWSVQGPEALRAARCMLRAEPSAEALRAARAEAVARAEARWDLAWAARALAPARPGRLAPQGEADALRRLPATVVRSWLATARQRARLSVQGHHPHPDRAARHLLAALTPLPPGALPPTPPVPRPASTRIVAAPAGADPRRFVLVWGGRRGEPPEPARMEQLAEALRALDVTVIRIRRGVLPGLGPWASVAAVLRDPAQRRGLPSLLATAARLASGPSLRGARWVLPLRPPTRWDHPLALWRPSSPYASDASRGRHGP